MAVIVQKNGMRKVLVVVVTVVIATCLVLFMRSNDDRGDRGGLSAVVPRSNVLKFEPLETLQPPVQPRLPPDELGDPYIDQIEMEYKISPDEQLNAKYWSAENQLLSNLIPTNIHLIWCGSRLFEFKHYLSIMSVIRTAKADKIILHYESRPLVDKLYYNQWIDELQHNQPFFILNQMSDDFVQFCTASHDTKIEMILLLLNTEGGIYIGENTWLLNFPPQKRNIDFEFALDATNMDGFIMMREGTINEPMPTNYRELLKRKDLKSKSSSCMSVHHLYTAGIKATCLYVKGGIYDSFTPMNIWELDDPFGKLCRRIFYGTEEIRHPKPSYDELVPNIAHMVWFGGGEMKFEFYLSVLSLLYVVKVERVYIYGDKQILGETWTKLREREGDRVRFITRSRPYWIYQDRVAHNLPLMSDVIRVDAMVKYGGIYTDTDAIWVKPLSHEERGYEAVASFDWIDWSKPFPDSINFGVSYGKKNAPYWRLFRESMRVLHNKNRGFTGVQNPYKILEKYPHLLRIDPHLQVICYKLKCHPTWVQDYHNMSKNHENMNSIPNWKEDVHAFHWTYPSAPSYANMSALLHGKGLFADIGKYVLYKAGLL